MKKKEERKTVTPDEVRLSVWRAVRNSSDHAINLTDWPFKINRQGIVVYEDELHFYCDGRSKPEVLTNPQEPRKIVFVPFVPQPDEPKSLLSPVGMTTALVRVS